MKAQELHQPQRDTIHAQTEKYETPELSKFKSGVESLLMTSSPPFWFFRITAPNFRVLPLKVPNYWDQDGEKSSSSYLTF